MTEWTRLGVAGGALLVALFCAVTASLSDRNYSRSSVGGRWAFSTAAVLLISCIALVALDAAGELGPFGAIVLVAVLAGAAVLACAGRHFGIQVGRGTAGGAALGLGGARLDVVLPAMGHALAERLAARNGAVNVPVVLVSVAGDDHLVELNQN